jgi:hypothetical protein
VIASAEPLLKKLLFEGRSGKRMWAALLAIATGFALLLIAVLIWWNFRLVLSGKASDDSLGSTFLTVSKRVTNANMGQPEQTVFQPAETDALRKAPEVEDLGVVQAVRPKSYMSINIAPGAGMSTIMVLESVPDRFMDARTGNWSWKPGNPDVPIILSSSFLSLYNYAFAPSQGLPQLPEESIRIIPLKLEIGDAATGQTFTAHIVGFSDRITSVLVPESFVNAMNAGGGEGAASRVILKVKDPSSAEFASFLETRGYVTNSEMLRWSRMRAIVQSVALVTGIFAVVLLGISLLVFVLFIELTVARAKDSVSLLQQLGYSPDMLRRFLMKRFMPLLGTAVSVALIVALAVQALARNQGTNAGLHLPLVPGWPFWAVVIAVLVLMVLQLRKAVRAALAR